MASTTHSNQQQTPSSHGATAAPPPTPSTQAPNHLSTSDDAAATALSRLLHRLPPSLSFPPIRLSSTATCPTLTSLSDQNAKPLLSSASQLGFFQLAHHHIPPQLARSAESESLALFDLPPDQKRLYFPKNWPTGFDDGDDDEGEGGVESFCLDSSCSEESAELSLSSLREFTRAMEKLGMEVVELLSCAVGFENPFREDPNRVCSLMWVSECLSPGRLYPYVVGLQYQMRSQKYSLLGDSGWVGVTPRVDSVLITIGDIAQVWSNGKLKKVRGRPMIASPSGAGHLQGDMLNSNNDNKNSSRCISMSLLLTLPLDATVRPLPRPTIGGEHRHLHRQDDDDEVNYQNDEGQVGDTTTAASSTGGEEAEGEERMMQVVNKFNSFSLEDYAWRVYHERLILKDPLDRYRLINN
ncbi:1-aminocyclopropane-1-carboxylate oxidase 2 [Malania oleifera]|uniref:1-aminocyclopropane-1-carboxylate oxidase 2 n=1 Tax=Malania oleifera TaxID=397392 RepID=UPI0025AE2928|nr:1-aminocyclopropane-1-carboxylate oxidase 2 [Malania oleifera]